MAQHVSVLGATLQHFQGAVPASRAVLTSTSPELVLATGGLPVPGTALLVTGKPLNTHSKVTCWETNIPQPRYLGYFMEIWRIPALFWGVIVLFEVYELAQHCSASDSAQKLSSPSVDCVCVCVSSISCVPVGVQALGVARSCKEVCTL